MLSPFQGTIYTSNNNEITILHNFNNKEYLSKFTGISPIGLTGGSGTPQGTKIGKAKKDLTFTITNKDGNQSFNLYNFFYPDQSQGNIKIDPSALSANTQSATTKDYKAYRFMEPLITAASNAGKLAADKLNQASQSLAEDKLKTDLLKEEINRIKNLMS